jgi:hypothetical protein
MVGPAAKRDAVAHLRGVLEMSERRACSLVAADRKMIRNRHGGRQRPSCVPGCTSLPINGAASAIVASTSCCGTKASDPASISSTGSIARRDWLCANAEVAARRWEPVRGSSSRPSQMPVGRSTSCTTSSPAVAASASSTSSMTRPGSA